MITEPPLPDTLRVLFPDGEADGRALSVALPAGRTVVPEDAEDDRPAYWLSDDPVSPALWRSLRDEHPRSGLWPLMLGALDDDAEDFRPWGEGEVAPEDMSSPDDHDAAALLAEWWRDHTGPDEDDALSPAERDGVTAPYGDWPGLAPTTATTADPEHAAVDLAETLFAVFGTMRLGLVRAERGADALTALGWTGPVNCIGDTAEVSAVVRDWERRFGARVVGVGFDTLYLSVAAPPATREEALRVAAEHFAFCPDNVWQSRDAQTLAAYADRLVGERSWAFWWD